MSNKNISDEIIFNEITPEQITQNTFQLIGKDWMLITAAHEGKGNTMTASWGGFGVMWQKNVAYIVIRPQRYTKEFIDSSTSFSLSFFPSAYKKQLAYLGSVSGRDEDKIGNSGLTLTYDEDIPHFTEAHTVVQCRKLFAQEYQPESFIHLDPNEFYPEKDYHTLYIGEITKVLVRDKDKA